MEKYIYYIILKVEKYIYNKNVIYNYMNNWKDKYKNVKLKYIKKKYKLIGGMYGQPQMQQQQQQGYPKQFQQQ